MATDNNGIVWLGTTDRGVCSFDGKFFTHYDFSKTLGHAYVAGIAKDNQNNMWFATSTGVNKFDGKHFMSYTTEQGLTSNIAKNVIQDRAGNIWVGTMNGLNRLVEPRDGDSVARFKKYTATEGFSGRGTYDHSISVNTNGDLWIGANDRVTRYHPMHDMPDTIPPGNYFDRHQCRRRKNRLDGPVE